MSTHADSPDVIVTEVEGRGIAHLAAYKGQAPRVAERFQAHFGLTPAAGPRRVSRGELAIAGIGPGTWLATHERAGNAFADSLQPVLGQCAAICDQSDAYVMLRLSGRRVRELLAKLVPLDLHARGFPVDAVARTVCGSMGVTLWRLDDAADGAPAFEIWAGRSFEASLHRAIAHGAAPFALPRAPPAAGGPV